MSASKLCNFCITTHITRACFRTQSYLYSLKNLQKPLPRAARFGLNVHQMLCRFVLRPHSSLGSLQHFRRTTDVLVGGAVPGMEGEMRDKWKGKGWREGHRVVCQGHYVPEAYVRPP